MTIDEQKAIVTRFIEAYNSFDIDGMLACVHPEVVFKNIAGDEINASATGLDDFRTLAQQSKTLFSSRRQLVTKWRCNADIVSVEIEYEGVLATDLPNGMKTGEVLKLNGRSEYEFQDSKLFRITDFS